MGRHWANSPNELTLAELRDRYNTWYRDGGDPGAIVILVQNARGEQQVPPNAVLTTTQVSELLGPEGVDIVARIQKAPPIGMVWLLIIAEKTGSVALVAFTLLSTKTMRPFVGLKIPEEGRELLRAEYRAWIANGREPDVVLWLSEADGTWAFSRIDGFIERKHLVRDPDLMRFAGLIEDLEKPPPPGHVWVLQGPPSKVQVILWSLPMTRPNEIV